MKTRQLLCIGLALAWLAGSTFAVGIRAPDQDAFAVARGNAFVATADNPSALYYNPAGISLLDGINLRGGLYGIYMKDEYRNAGLSYDTKDKLGLLPQLYGTMAIKDTPLTVGLGIYCPYGLALEWPDTAPLSYAAKKGSVTYVTFNPVLSWKILPNLSLAAGPTINYSEAILAQNMPIPGPPRQFQFQGDDVAFGANAGLLWKPHEKHSLGVSYRSPTTLNYTGHTTALGLSDSASAEFRYPQNIIAGWSFRPTPEWNLEFDVDWTDWSYLGTVNLHQAQPAPPVFASTVPLNFNWDSSFWFSFGATRYFSKGWSVSAGYIYSQNSVPSSAFSPVVPDSDRHVFSVGVGRKWKQFSWDLAYQFAYGPQRTVAEPEPVGGNYTFYSHALNLSVGYRF
jgi:long-chain fatty acid transport protein